MQICSILHSTFIWMDYSNIIKKEAYRLGFDFCGIAKAEFLEEEAPRLEQWLLQNKHGKMKYMENYFDKRLDPRKLVDGAKSVISLLYNYFPSDECGVTGDEWGEGRNHAASLVTRHSSPVTPLISKYAY